MKLSGNTILITGGGSGIGLALAEEFKKLENHVLIAGRSPAKLEAAAKKGFTTFSVDMTDAKSIGDMTAQVLKDFPALNVVIHNAGIMKNENILKSGNQKIQDETIATNLLGPMRLTDALLPHFEKQKHATIMTVTSGLAYLPLSMTPTYCASKAAIHSYTQSLRYQLQKTAIEVVELIPPYVQTGLMGARQLNDPLAMPLNEFIAEVFQIFKSDSNVREVAVKRVHPLRFSGYDGGEKYDAFYKQFNDRMNAARAGEL